MKKTLGIILASACFALTAQAQLSRGFYRIQNKYTDRYISIADNDKNNYPISTTTFAMKGIKTLKAGENVSTNPSTVFLVHNVGGIQYDIEGQGTSIHKISGGRLYMNLEAQSDGSYQAYGVYQAKIYLTDDTDTDAEESYLKNSQNSSVIKKTSYWWARPINTYTEYICIKPEVEVDGKYYGTIFASFAFKLASSGMKAYTVNTAAGNTFTLQEIPGTIPAKTPVIIECSSNNYADNKILPVEETGKAGGNLLIGTYCARKDTKYLNVTPYDNATMRTIGKSNGKLAFVKASSSDLYEGAYLKANKAYLQVPSSASEILTMSGITGIDNIKADEAEETAKKGTYTLTGVRIADDVTPKPGIYIKDGKKVVIK